MSLSDWQTNGWLKPHAPDAAEIRQLLDVVERDLRVSADPNLDCDWRFAIAFNAALQAAAIALNACGHEATKGGGAHHYTIDSLRLTIGADASTIDAFQAFRAKRGGAIYERTGIATTNEVEELRHLAIEVRNLVVAWLKANRPDLYSE